MRHLYLVILPFFLLLASCNNGASITLSQASAQLKVGDIITLEATPVVALEWASSDDSVATVYHGVVTANAIGKATITATSGKSTASCVVFVTGSNGATLRISPALATLDKGDTFQFYSGNAYELDETWSSSDESIATISSTGLVTAHNPGVATITLSTSFESVTAIVAVNHHWGEYQLVWSDEFNGTSLDQNTWGYNTGGGGWGNRESQHYTNRTENVRVEDGYLKIQALQEEYNGDHYTSGRILSRGKKDFLYGRIESRIKFPGGGGTWPAFWMMGNSGGWPACGEIDIMEHVGNNPNRASFALHTPEKNGTKGNNWHATHMFDYSLADDFHVYAVEWAQEEKNGLDVIRFFVDDVQYAEVWESVRDNNNYWPFIRPHYIIFNLAIGGNMGGNIANNLFDQERIMYVDWVRVYQRSDIE